MKSVGQILCLALVGSGLAATPLLQASAGAVAGSAPDDLLSQMRASADGETEVVETKATGKVGFIRVASSDGDLQPGTDGASPAAAADKADAYLADYAEAFGARSDELSQTGVTGNAERGWTVTYTQSYQGLQVFGAALKANVDADGDLTSVNGVAVPELDLSVDPAVTKVSAGERATAMVKADPPGGHRVSGLKSANAELIVYREGLVRGRTGDNILAWYVEVTDGAGVRDAVFIDAATGKPVNRYSLVHTDLERRLYDEVYQPDALIWEEGDPFPGALSQWQQSEVTTTGDTYWFFNNTFDRQSYDGEGHVMETINNDPRIDCPNANWNGETTNYCDGTATDDVVAHEWGHAYTEYTGGLIYQWQPGALNEGYSDIWGETIDLINGRDDDDEGDIDTPRPDGDCSTIGAARDRAEHGDKVCAGDAVTGGDSFTDGASGREGAAASDSYRWLVGEDATAFGGAIRDMWNPTCMGDPGKVSDAQYWCQTRDAGGVHSNSGVPNHAYALLVDGGTYNGVTVPGVGLDKAANIWWRAQEGYQTPATGFPEHADNLDAACADLTGTTVSKLSTTESADPGTVTIEAADCDAVKKATDAVEFRTEPTQCNFKPMFDPADPQLCGEGTTTSTVWSEDFEDGLDGWETDQNVVNDGASGFPWEAATSAPGDHDSAVAYGPTPDGGTCANNAGDYTSTDSIISPEVTLPGTLSSPKLSFSHSVATEVGYDGGNVKISVNGGGFTTIPNSAYVFNKGTRLATVADQNTNPLAGQDGFTGTDGGLVTGAWGTSVVDLTKLAVKGGDKVKIRFEIGRDGCGGIDGWYVDDVQITTCDTDGTTAAPTKVTARHQPDPSRFGKPSKVTATVKRTDGGTPAPNGKVVLKNAKGKTVASGKVTKGKATLKLKGKTFKVGKNKATVVYLGNKSFSTSQVKITIKVKKKK